MLQSKIDIDTSVPSVTARTTRPLSITAVKPRTEAGRSSNSNSFCQPCFLCRCTYRLELIAGELRYLSNFYKVTENLPFSLRHVIRSCHQAPLHFLLWQYESFIIVLCIVLLYYSATITERSRPSQLMCCRKCATHPKAAIVKNRTAYTAMSKTSRTHGKMKELYINHLIYD